MLQSTYPSCWGIVTELLSRHVKLWFTGGNWNICSVIVYSYRDTHDRSPCKLWRVRLNLYYLQRACSRLRFGDGLNYPKLNNTKHSRNNNKHIYTIIIIIPAYTISIVIAFKCFAVYNFCSEIVLIFNTEVWCDRTFVFIYHCIARYIPV